MIVELKDIFKSYSEGEDNPRRDILDSFNLSINFDESISIVGPSGCGKTTLLNILGTLDKPDSGEVVFNGELVTNMNDDQLSKLRAEKIGFIFQSHHLLPQISVIENVILPTLAVNSKQNNTIIFDEAETLLSEVGLKNEVYKFPSQLSGGEKQRVAIVRSLINKPNLVLADEPTGSLDKSRGEEIIDLLKSLCVNNQTSLVVVTHDIEIASQMKRRLCFKNFDFIES
ncbi:MAG: ABC transporter [Verrucomicrobiales bacterium]|nr:ABC transporter [Verrucomicrobiales bacterium]|tara:strand:+ start:2397 stop:3080 length:684 start_codon:yes stop_codon:yes gene_type:complete